ncbi:component of SufBCD complex [Escherichia coli]|nr:component of SufBCD complex [Escherichia coli]
MDMHSGTFNPQDFAWQGLTLTPRSGDTHPRTGGKAAWYDRRALRR